MSREVAITMTTPHPNISFQSQMHDFKFKQKRMQVLCVYL